MKLSLFAGDKIVCVENPKDFARKTKQNKNTPPRDKQATRAGLQDTRLTYRSQSLSQTPAMIKRNFKAKPHHHLHQHQKKKKQRKKEILRYKSKKISPRAIQGKLQNSHEWNQRTKQVERDSMLTGRKTQQCQDVSASQLDLYSQCNPKKDPSKLFWDINKPILKVIGRGKRPSRANITLKKKKAGRLTPPNFRIYYKATVIKTVLVLLKEQTDGPKEQNREPRNRPPSIQSTDL